MGREHREWAKRARLKLIEELGGKCVHCGTTGAEDNRLEIDHKDPKFDWTGYRRMDPSWRVSVYRREAKEGKLQVLCHDCNCKKGPNYPRYSKRNKAEVKRKKATRAGVMIHALSEENAEETK